MRIRDIEKYLDLSEMETSYHRLLRVIFGHKESFSLRFGYTVEELRDTMQAGLFPYPLDEEAIQSIESALAELPERENDVLRRRFALDPYQERQILDVVGKAHGLSKERARQLQWQALAKMRRSECLDKIRDIPISWAGLRDQVKALRSRLKQTELEFAKFKQRVEDGWAQDDFYKEEWRKRHLLLDKPVSDFELSVRTTNCLRDIGIESVRDLVLKSEAQMLRYRNFGRKSLNELKLILNEMGLSFGMQEPL